MKEEAPDPKTSLENVDPNNQNRGRRRRSTRFENLFGECRSEDEESWAGGEKNMGRRRSSTGVGKVNGGTQVLKTWVPRGFFFFPH